MNINRKSGVLLHISSLPTKYGVGTLGKEAYEFIDWMESAGLKIWQVLPLVPTNYGDSPYQSVCSTALNYYFIDFDILEEKGLLAKADYEGVFFGNNEDRVDYSALFNNKVSVLKKAFSNYNAKNKEFEEFLAKHEYDDFSLFMTIKALNNYKCIILWTIFNEGWGQFNSTDVYLHLRNLDKTRFYDKTSGWHDQGDGEIASYHYYFQEYKFKKDKKERATVLSEFGGNIFRIKDHVYNEKDFIYKKIETEEEFLQRLKEQFNNIKIQKEKGLTGSIYTQISDVEEESNGFITFDRKVVKSSIEELNKIISI